MRMIYEENVERHDFFEIILNETDIEALNLQGVVKEFQGGLRGERNLNVYLWVDKEKDNPPTKPMKKVRKKKTNEKYVSDGRENDK